MELFPDGACLRLWSRTYDAYLHAVEDGVEVTLRERCGTLHEAWVVHRLERDGATYVLLRSAAYGRYFALVHAEEEDDDDDIYSCRGVQRVYDDAGQDDVLWQVLAADDGSDDVRLGHRTFAVWCDDEGTEMQFMVEAIPPRADPPELPPVVPPPAVPVGGPIRRQCQGVQPPPPPPPVLRRIIHYARADDQGNFIWRMLWFDGRSVSHLRSVLAARLGVGEANVLDITLCVQAGSNGRLTPLVIDLPCNRRAMDIVVLATGSPAAQALVHPDVDAP